MATLLKVLNNLADIKSAGVLHFTSELRGGPLPLPFDELSADYSSSTLGDLFPTAVTGSVDFESIMNDPRLFGDSDHAGGFDFFVNASGSWPSGPSNFDPSEDRPRKAGSCASDGSSSAVHRCETQEDLSSLITTGQGAGSDGADQSGLQSSTLPGLNAPVGGDFLSAKQILGLEMIAAQNTFTIAWPLDTNQGTFPPTCDACDVTPPVDGASAPSSDFVDPTGSSNFNPGPDPLFVATFADLGVTPPAPSVPEISPAAMPLIGFAGLALAGRRRLWGSTRLGWDCAEPGQA
jgi:hypothetical protein